MRVYTQRSGMEAPTSRKSITVEPVTEHKEPEEEGAVFGGAASTKGKRLF